MKQKSVLPVYVKIACIIDLACLGIGMALAFSNIEKDLTLMGIGFGLIGLGLIGIFIICLLMEKTKKNH